MTLLGVDGRKHAKVALDNHNRVSFTASQLTKPLELIVLSGVSELGASYVCSGSAGDHAEYYVMLLDWDEEVAERCGVGTVRNDGLLNSFKPGPAWKEITLA